jgi:uncharacterized protein YbaR (Trm112 family)
MLEANGKFLLEMLQGEQTAMTEALYCRIVACQSWLKFINVPIALSCPETKTQLNWKSSNV